MALPDFFLLAFQSLDLDTCRNKLGFWFFGSGLIGLSGFWIWFFGSGFFRFSKELVYDLVFLDFVFRWILVSIAIPDTKM